MSAGSLFLAGDIGGTKTTLALMEATGDGALAVRREETFKSPEHPSLEEIVRRFLGGEKVALAGASFGVAGAIIDGRCKTTNLAWTEMSEASLAKAAICGRWVTQRIWWRRPSAAAGPRCPPSGRGRRRWPVRARRPAPGPRPSGPRWPR